MYKHRPGARVQSGSKYPRSAASPTCGFLEEGEVMDNKYTITVYGQGEHTLFIADFLL